MHAPVSEEPVFPPARQRENAERDCWWVDGKGKGNHRTAAHGQVCAGVAGPLVFNMTLLLK